MLDGRAEGAGGFSGGDNGGYRSERAAPARSAPASARSGGGGSAPSWEPSGDLDDEIPF
jgi:hypothetical protein